MVFITFKPQHTKSSERLGEKEKKKRKTELPFFLKWKSTKWIGAAEIFYITMTNTAKWGGEREREREREGRDSALEREREREGETHDDRQKRADQTERPNCVKKKKKSAQFVLDCKLRAERRNKIRHLAGDHVKPCKWTSPQRRVFPLSLMMDLIASISVKI